MGAIYIDHAGSEIRCLEGCEFIRNSAGGSGGAVICSGGTFIASDTTFEENTALNSGIVWNNGSLTLERCTFANNEGEAAVRLIDGSGSMTNCTVTGTFPGDAVSVQGASTFSIGHCTLAESHSSGIEVSSAASVDVGYTIFWRNFSSVELLGGTVTSNGFNLLPENHPAFDASTDDLENTDAMLLPLGWNGGLTQTHGLPFGSPAIDVGELAPSIAPDLDQRGLDRVVDGDDNLVSRCDIGAYEFAGAVVVDTEIDEIADPGTGMSLREALIEAGSGGLIRIAPNLNGATIELASSAGGQGSPLEISRDVTIDGGLLKGLTP